MNTKKTTASKAVKAAACQKEPASTLTLPSMKQAMLTAVALVQQSLNGLERVRIHDEEWDECDVDTDYSVRLVHECLDKLRDRLPDDRGIFDHQWFTAAAIINLCVSSFSRTDCLYYRMLTGLQKQFDVLASLVEFVGGEAQHA